MADYSKLKVQELKDELKSRGAALTGLKLKQQFIDRLIELDQQAVAEKDKDEPSPGNEVQPEAVEAAEETAKDATPPVLEADAPMPDVVGEEQRQDEATSPETPEISMPQKQETPPTDVAADPSTQEAAPSSEFNSAEPAVKKASTPPTTDSVEREVTEESRKRKRRSVTPVPASAEVSIKKAKALDGSPRATLTEDFDKSQNAVQSSIPTSNGNETAVETKIDNAQALPQADDPRGESAPGEKIDSTSPAEADKKLDDSVSTKSTKLPSPPPAQEKEEDRQVSPALHPATSTLYIRNLKRPLQVATLQNHLEKLASRSPSTSDSDAVTEIFLDNIKTHAFVSFASISAASRVRSRLHDTRWPEEPMRDALWVDFIPDEKVKGWIEIENSSGGRGMGLKRWEVVYEPDTNDVIQASLQEIGARPPGLQQAPFAQPPVAPQTQDRPSVVHPSRQPRIPPSPSRRGFSPPHHPAAISQPKASGPAFRALDDLFSSTQTAKPKLYYKPVPSNIAEARLDAFRDLFRVDRIEPGEEMRRYSFDDGERAKWVDRGAEWGRKAETRTRGRGRGFGFGGGGGGGWRGGGGGGGWRGGGGRGSRGGIGYRA